MPTVQTWQEYVTLGDKPLFVTYFVSITYSIVLIGAQDLLPRAGDIVPPQV